MRYLKVLLVFILTISLLGCSTEVVDCKEVALTELENRYSGSFSIVSESKEAGMTGLDGTKFVYTMINNNTNKQFEVYVSTDGTYLGDTYPKSVFDNDIINTVKNILVKYTGVADVNYEYNYLVCDNVYTSYLEYISDTNNDSYLSLNANIAENSFDSAASIIYSILEELGMYGFKYNTKFIIIGGTEVSFNNMDGAEITSQYVIDKISKAVDAKG